MDDVAQDQPGAGDRHSELLQQVRTACAEWGFFQVKNHGVPLSVMTQMQQVVHEFLELPPEEKNKVSFTNPEGVTIEEGYTSRQGMSEGAISMWSDRLRYTMFPMSTRNCDLWPKNPSRFR
jgi:isopenicillin N synthase-like dioxygenase